MVTKSFIDKEVLDEHMYVDVIMPTWNSNVWYFPLALKHVKEVLEPHHFIVVDRFSTDGTQEVVKKFFNEKLRLVKTDANLALARKIGGVIADTDVVCYIDDDVLIPLRFRSTINKVISYLLEDKKIGVIAFALCNDDTYHNTFTKISRIIKPLSHVYPKDVLTRGIHVLSRGFTFFFCAKKELIESWNVPPDLSAYEDYHLSQHILGKGYLWVELSLPCVIHMKDYRYKGLRRYIKQGLWEGANVVRAGVPSKYVILHVAGRLMGAIHKKDPRQFFTYVGYIVGILAQKRFRSWKRG